jgi:hypothetical protein
LDVLFERRKDVPARKKQTSPQSNSGRRRPGTTAGSSKPQGKTSKKKRWSASVMQQSDALDLEPGVFRMRSPGTIAASLKHSAEESRRRKGTPYQSAMSMLTIYINRAGRQLSAGRRRILERAKAELRKVFDRAA